MLANPLNAMNTKQQRLDWRVLNLEAATKFVENRNDIRHLLGIHSALAGKNRGRRPSALGVLNRSAIVLTAALWEAFLEDVCLEAIRRVVDELPSSSRLPNSVKVAISRRFDMQRNPMSPWELADRGWAKAWLHFGESEIGRFHNPTSENVRTLVSNLLGIPDVTAMWTWAGMSNQQACKKLDDFLILRGEIAHRVRPGSSIQKKVCADFMRHVFRLVLYTSDYVRAYLYLIVGPPPGISVSQHRVYQRVAAFRKMCKLLGQPLGVKIQS